jgi:hypothetical protein
MLHYMYATIGSGMESLKVTKRDNHHSKLNIELQMLQAPPPAFLSLLLATHMVAERQHILCSRKPPGRP